MQYHRNFSPYLIISIWFYKMPNQVPVARKIFWKAISFNNNPVTNVIKLRKHL